jgi:hypothetical protein
MSQLIPVKFGEVQIWMEPDETVVAEPRLDKVSVDGTAEKLMGLAERLSDTIKAYCVSLVTGIKELPKETVPKTVTVEFGLKLSMDGNIYVVKTSGEASLKVTAQWEMI